MEDPNWYRKEFDKGYSLYYDTLHPNSTYSSLSPAAKDGWDAAQGEDHEPPYLRTGEMK
jgi:hypothetical protein